MLLLNFSHPLTPAQRGQIEAMTGGVMAEVRQIPAQFDNAQPYPSQIRALVDGIRLTAEEWQTRPILVNPPSYNFAALILLAELHGRMGYFPTMVRIRPVLGNTPPLFEVAEILNLQTIRDEARKSR